MHTPALKNHKVLYVGIYKMYYIIYILYIITLVYRRIIFFSGSRTNDDNLNIVRIVLLLQLQPMRVFLLIIIHCRREANNFLDDYVNNYSIDTRRWSFDRDMVAGEGAVTIFYLQRE